MMNIDTIKKMNLAMKRNQTYMSHNTHDILYAFLNPENSNYYQAALTVVEREYGTVYSRVTKDSLMTGKFYGGRQLDDFQRHVLGTDKKKTMNLATNIIAQRDLPPDLMEYIINEASMTKMVSDLAIHASKHTLFGGGDKYVSLDELPRSVISTYNYFNELAIDYLEGEVSLEKAATIYRKFFSYIAVTQALAVVGRNNPMLLNLEDYKDGIQVIDTIDRYDSRVVDIYMDTIDPALGEAATSAESAMSQAMVYYYNLFINSIFAMKIDKEEYQIKLTTLVSKVANDMYSTEMMFNGLSEVDNFENSEDMEAYKAERGILGKIMDDVYLQYECIASSLFSRLTGPMIEIYDALSNEDPLDVYPLMGGAPKLLHIFNSGVLAANDALDGVEGSMSKSMTVHYLHSLDTFKDQKIHINLDNYNVNDFNFMAKTCEEMMSILGATIEQLQRCEYENVTDNLIKIEETMKIPFKFLVCNLVAIVHWIDIMNKMDEK